MKEKKVTEEFAQFQNFKIIECRGENRGSV